MKHDEVTPMGYLAGNWLGANEETPALVVNPQASAVDLMAWVCGELRSLEAAAYALTAVSARDSSIEVRHFEAMFVHRIAPMERVLELALCQLIAQRKTDDAPTSAAPPSASTQGGVA